MPAIWITGGKGFIGRQVAALVGGKGHGVYGVGHGLWSSQDAAKSSYALWLNGEIESSNLSQLAQVSGPPDTIYHLAGGSSVGASFLSPQEDFSRTVETTVRLLEWVRLNSAESRVVSVSSAAVYGAHHAGNISEDEPITPYSPYGFHKAMMEQVCQSYSSNFGLRIAIVRLFSVYGERLEKQLIWDLCCKLAVAGAGSIELGGTGQEMRDWIHVSDAASLLWLARDECDATGKVFNGGTGAGTRIAEVATLAQRAWGASGPIVFNGKARLGDPISLVADVSRAGELGFRPTVGLELGIADTVGWFKRHRSKA